MTDDSNRVSWGHGSVYHDADQPVGLTVLSVASTPERITLLTSGGTFTLTAEGDCCSSSWFEHTDDDGIMGGVITSVEGTDPPAGWAMPPDGHEGSDYLQCTFVTVATTKGRLCIELRNDSNGYYGGSIRLSGPEHL